METTCSSLRQGAQATNAARASHVSQALPWRVFIIPSCTSSADRSQSREACYKNALQAATVQEAWGVRVLRGHFFEHPRQACHQ
jgi:hypothetical protein